MSIPIVFLPSTIWIRFIVSFLKPRASVLVFRIRALPAPASPHPYRLCHAPKPASPVHVARRAPPPHSALVLPPHSTSLPPSRRTRTLLPLVACVACPAELSPVLVVLTMVVLTRRCSLPAPTPTPRINQPVFPMLQNTCLKCSRCFIWMLQW
jgi:hypothetical protein